MSRRLEKLIEQKAWETLTDHGYNDAQLLEQLTDATVEKLTEQVGRIDAMGILDSWNNLIGMINNIMETISQGLPQHSEFNAMVSMVDYDGDGQVTFNDLTIALSLWGQGIMPATAQQYQNGQLIVDESGLGEQLPPEGEELLNVLTSGQQIKGPVGPRPEFRDRTIQLKGVRPIPRGPVGSFGGAPQVPGYGRGDGFPGGYPVRPPVGPPMGGPF